MPLKLYGVLRSRASRNVWLLNELDMPFELVPVIQHYRLADASAPDAPFNTTSPGFRAIHPAGRIPAIDDDGLVLGESLAINLYLAKKHGGELSPRDLREDALMTAAALWLATDFEPHALQVLYNHPGAPAATRDAKAFETALAALAQPFAALDATLRQAGGHLVGGRFTVADINAAEVIRYAQPAVELFARHPSVKAWIEACQARPAFRHMWAEREKEPA